METYRVYIKSEHHISYYHNISEILHELNSRMISLSRITRLIDNVPVEEIDRNVLLLNENLTWLLASHVVYYKQKLNTA